MPIAASRSLIEVPPKPRSQNSRVALSSTSVLSNSVGLAIVCRLVRWNHIARPDSLQAGSVLIVAEWRGRCRIDPATPSRIIGASRVAVNRHRAASGKVIAKLLKKAWTI